jgi:hypothetical protein
MAFSNIVALAIMVTTAATLHVHGTRDIQTSRQAAEALKTFQVSRLWGQVRALVRSRPSPDESDRAC